MAEARLLKISRWLWTCSALASLFVALLTREAIFIAQTFVITVIATLRWSRRK